VFGYTAGAVINKTADVVSDTTKVGIDIAEGTVQSVGNLLIKSSGAVVDPNAKRLLDNAVDTPIRVKIPTPPPVYIPVPVPVPVPVEVKVPVYSPGSKNSSVSFNSLLNNPITRFLMYDPSKTPAPTVPLPTVPLRTTAAPTTAAPTTAAPTTAAPTTAVPTESASKIQNPISSNKISWCFTGEYQGKRGCVDVTDQSKCFQFLSHGG
jgi:outer membrane biosynthesis protein TonB